MNLPFSVRTTGRAAKPLEAAVARELSATDLAALGAEKGSKPPALKRISERHHALARTLASGTSPGEAALICRYDISRVSILQNDPAFQELVTFYRGEVSEKYLGLHEQLAGLAGDAAELLRDQLEADFERPVDERKLSPGQLMEVTKLGADRTGHGPQSSSTQVNINVDLASRLQAARERVKARQLTIEADV